MGQHILIQASVREDDFVLKKNTMTAAEWSFNEDRVSIHVKNIENTDVVFGMDRRLKFYEQTAAIISF